MRTGMTDRAAALVCIPACGALLLIGAGCHQPPTIRTDDPQLTAFLDVVLPREIEIQDGLTQLRRFDGAEAVNGIDVVLRVSDAQHDRVKCLGSFQFDLHRMRMASADKLGRRLEQWRVDVWDGRTLARYWDGMSLWYDFPLRLEGNETLEPGRYVLTVRLHTLGERTLFDEYEFAHKAGD
jgi:hypothetical protein